MLLELPHSGQWNSGYTKLAPTGTRRCRSQRRHPRGSNAYSERGRHRHKDSQSGTAACSADPFYRSEQGKIGLGQQLGRKVVRAPGGIHKMIISMGRFTKSEGLVLHGVNDSPCGWPGGERPDRKKIGWVMVRRHKDF